MSKEDIDELDDDLFSLLEDENGEPEDPKFDLSELKNLVDELKKENQGLLKAKQEEKHKRQDVQTRLSKIEGTIGEILTKKTPGKEEPDPAKDTLAGITVEFTPDGRAYIPSTKVNELISPHQQRIKQLEEELLKTKAETTKAKSSEQTINAILGENEKFPSAYTKFNAARNWINKQVIEYQNSTGVQGAVSSAQVLDEIVDKDMEDQFNEKFPGMDIETVVTGFDSIRLFKKALSQISKGSEAEAEKVSVKKTNDNERFKKVLNKPSSLTNMSNAKKTSDSILDQLESLSTKDIMDLSDSQIRALEKAMREEDS